MSTTAVIKGRVTRITEELTLKSGYKCRYIVVYDENEQNPKYSDTHGIQVQNNNYPLIDKFRVGAMVTATINISSNEWQGPTGNISYFHTLKLWKLESIGAEQHQPVEHESVGFNNSDAEKDIPF